MKKIISMFYVVILSAIFTVSLFSQNTNENSKPKNNLRKLDQVSQRSLFSDYKAMGIGDAVTVLIVEDTEAGNSAGTNENRNSGLQAGVGAGVNGTSAFDADANLSTGNNFKGSGSNSRKESIRSKLSARVIEEDERGNFIVEGNRKTKVNGEDQTIVLRGVIRPADIRSDNTIYSYNIMDLELYVDGEGNISKMQKPGLFTRFFRLLF